MMRARLQASPHERETSGQVRRVATASRGGPAHALQQSLGNRIVGHALRSGGAGSPVPARVRSEVEARHGESLAPVRVHADSSEAVALGTPAFIRGEHVHFAPGALGRDIVRGSPVLRHELGHVGQQRRGEVPVTGFVAGIAVNTDPGLEAAANAAGARAARQAPAGLRGAVAQLYTYNGAEHDAETEDEQVLREVVEAWAKDKSLLVEEDVAEVVNALATKCVATRKGSLGVSADARTKLIGIILNSQGGFNEAVQTLITAESRELASDVKKAPKGLLEKISGVWDRMLLTFDSIDSTGAVVAFFKDNNVNSGIESASAVLGPIGVGLSLIGMAGNLQSMLQAIRRAAQAEDAFAQAGAEVHDVLEFARDANRKSAGVHFIRAVIDACIVAFGAVTLATLGWGSPALLAAGIAGIMASVYSWWSRRRAKKDCERAAETLWTHRQNQAVMKMLGNKSWGGFTDEELGEYLPSPTFKAKFLREVSDALMPA